MLKQDTVNESSYACVCACACACARMCVCVCVCMCVCVNVCGLQAAGAYVSNLLVVNDAVLSVACV